MEFFLWYLALSIVVVLLFDIRSRLPKPEKHKDFSFIFDSREGFRMRCDQLYEKSLCLDLTAGNRIMGRSFMISGEIIPYHEEYREKQKLEFSGRQSVTFHPVEKLISSRIGMISGKGRYDVDIWLPFELHSQVLNDFRLNHERQFECDIAENSRKKDGDAPTYGVYRIEIDGH